MKIVCEVMFNFFFCFGVDNLVVYVDYFLRFDRFIVVFLVFFVIIVRYCVVWCGKDG